MTTANRATAHLQLNIIIIIIIIIINPNSHVLQGPHQYPNLFNMNSADICHTQYRSCSLFRPITRSVQSKLTQICPVIGLLTAIWSSWLSGALPQRWTSDPPADSTIKVCTHSHRHSDKNTAGRAICNNLMTLALQTRLLLWPTKTVCGVRSRKQIRFHPLGKTKGRWEPNLSH
jgi:hypothetical protein